MSLADLLACPRCRVPLPSGGSELVCPKCARRYPIARGVPVLLPDPGAREVVHEDVLVLRPGFEAEVERMIAAVPPHLPVLDLGAGNRKSDDPRLVRMDVFSTPYVDVIGDAHALPFRDGVFGMVHSSAVFEHLARPWIAAEEIRRVLCPGGYVFADGNFVFPYHGYPAVYFNASADGLRQLFASFHEFGTLVFPWHRPGYGLRAILGEYLRLIRPETDEERAWCARILALSDFPFERFDARLAQAEAARVAAGTTFVGMRPLDGAPGLVPPPVRTAWEADSALRARYPDPHCPWQGEPGERFDSLLGWAMSEGRRTRPEIAAWYAELAPFLK
jgi:uncharacterized protein YbaR (Trm112 family)